MSHRKLAFTFIAGLGVAGAFAEGTRANAADLDLDSGYASIPPASEQKVEFGTGWYIRGDLGANRSPSISPVPERLLTNEQAVDYYSGTPYRDPQLYNEQASQSDPSISGGSNLGYTASLGAGYQFNRWFRADLIADFHKPIAASASQGDIFCQTAVSYPTLPTGAPDYSGNGTPATGDCTGIYAAKIQSYDVMFNGYFDIGTWYSVTPYVGAGAGLGFGHYQTSATFVQGNNQPYQITYSDPKYGSTNSPNFNRTASGTYYNFAWSLMAGVSYDIYDHTKLDVGYRYINLGAISGVSGTLAQQEVRVGLRYMIDN